LPEPLALWPAAATTTTVLTGHKSGGAGAIAVFAVFVVALVVLAVLVFRFSKQVERRRRDRRPGG
jgi:small neutral amino acid transporter SnatA (MarC family)